MKKIFLIVQKTKAFITILFLFLLAAGCGKDEISADCQEKSIEPYVACITLYDSVCGCNKKTYSNSCYAWISGISVFTKGECPK